MVTLSLSTGSTLAEITAPGVAFCHSCDADMHWEGMCKGSARLRCTGCKTVFPCYHECEHVDCQSVREAWQKVTSPDQIT